MEEEQIWYLVRKKADIETCRIENYSITCLPLEVSGRWETILRGNCRWLKKLFRYLVLRKAVKGKGLVVLSGELEKLLPREIRYQNIADDFPQELYEAYAVLALSEAARSCEEAGRCANLLAMLPAQRISDACVEHVLEEGADMESLYFWTDDENEKDRIEERFEALMEESGVAGMCYNMEEMPFENPFGKSAPKGNEKECVIMLDFIGLPLGRLWGIHDYIDGSSKKNKKEIKILTSRQTQVKALRNYLDRGFCATLY